MRETISSQNGSRRLKLVVVRYEVYRSRHSMSIGSYDLKTKKSKSKIIREEKLDGAGTKAAIIFQSSWMFKS